MRRFAPCAGGSGTGGPLTTPPRSLLALPMPTPAAEECKIVYRSLDAAARACCEHGGSAEETKRVRRAVLEAAVERLGGSDEGGCGGERGRGGCR